MQGAICGAGFTLMAAVQASRRSDGAWQCITTNLFWAGRAQSNISKFLHVAPVHRSI